VKRLALLLAWLAPRGVVVLLLAVVGGAYLMSASVSPVLTGSMTPTFGPGSAVVTRAIPAAEVHVGQILVFTPPGYSSQFAHRVVSVSGDPAHPTIATQGDANAAPDAWRVTLTAQTAREVVTSVPSAGRAIVFAHQPLGRSALTGLIGLLLTFFAVRLVLVSGDTPAPALT
jgi:signal peptidase